MPVSNKQIARALAETASLIELTGGNTFRARALSNAARTLRNLDVSAAELVQTGKLTDINGIGKGLAAQIQEVLERGSFDLRDDLLNAVPPGLPALLRVKGLGTKKVRQLWKELDVTSLDELEAAAENNQIVHLDGFGAKTQANILENTRLQKRYDARRRLADAMQLAEQVVVELKKSTPLSQVQIAGEARRNMETVERIDLVASTTDLESVTDQLPSFSPDSGDLYGHAKGLQLATTVEGTFPVHLTLTDPDDFGTALWRVTGSPDHCAAFIERHGAPASFESEEALFTDAGLPVIPPEIREGTGEIEAAENDALPPLITTDDLKGTLHNHSTYSDGSNTLREMAEAARQMGLSYFGICDHSQSLTVAGGLSIGEVTRQQKEIEALNAEWAKESTPFRVFSGIESDILPDGSLDYPDEVLASFDFVVASVHSRFNMSEEEATDRIIRAIANPHTSILGHATGRLLLVREGYPVDHGRIIEACAQHDVAIELNANPYRLDMDWRFLRRAADAGVLISINPDAHSTGELHHVKWGVAVARKAWLTADQCLNALPLNKFEAWINS